MTIVTCHSFSVPSLLFVHNFRKIGILESLIMLPWACPDIEKAMALYRDVLGAKVSEKHVRINENYLPSRFNLRILTSN